jgi:hypothetical protein
VISVVKETNKISFAELKRIDEELKQTREEAEKLREDYYRRESLISKEQSLQRKYRRISNQLENLNRYKADEEQKKIVKKFLKFQEDSAFIFSEEHTFAEISKDGFKHHLTLNFNHFGHYDIEPILKKVEKISGLKAMEWWISVTRYVSGQGKISFHFTLNKDKGGKRASSQP